MSKPRSRNTRRNREPKPSGGNAVAAAAGGPGAHLSPLKRWLFWSLAMGVPTLVGTLGIVAALVWQGRLVVAPPGCWFSAGERALRLQPPPTFVQEPGHERTGHRYLHDARLGWRNIPRWRATTFGAPLNINSKGLRGPERCYAKPAGTRRILVLGDSYAWGYGVSDADVFSVVLEARLRGAGGTRWQVLNAGVSGWGTDQEYLFLLHEGLRYEPDIVVLAFFLLNDPTNLSASRQYGLDKPVFLDLDLRLGNVPVPKPDAKAPVIETQADLMLLTFTLLGRMADLTRQRGGQFLVMKFGLFLDPARPDWAALSRGFQREMRTRLPGVAFLDLDTAFRDRRFTATELVGDVRERDGHWNAFGHRQVAELLHQALLEKGLAKAAPPSP
jgi:hypothetical protein